MTFETFDQSDEETGPDIIVPFSSGNKSAISIVFFDNVFTFSNGSVNVACCHLNHTIELATCGLGVSCGGSCSTLGAFLCPSGDCSGDCRMSFGNEIDQNGAQSRLSLATLPSRHFKWCSAKCNVWRHQQCCFNPVCYRKSRSHKEACSWFNYLSGVMIISSSAGYNLNHSGETCRTPGNLTHGTWSCETAEIPVPGTSSLHESQYSSEPNFLWLMNF